MKNYGVYDLISKSIVFVGSLQACYNEFKHCGGFGIYNRTTNRTVIYNPSNQWKVNPAIIPTNYKRYKIYLSAKIVM